MYLLGVSRVLCSVWKSKAENDLLVRKAAACDSHGSCRVLGLKEALEKMVQEDLIICTAKHHCCSCFISKKKKVELQRIQEIPDVSQPHLVNNLGN